MTNYLHFRSNDGFFGDPMPLFADGVYHIYYTKMLVDKDFNSLCWGHISSTDLINWHELPDCIVQDEQDRALYTGSIIYHNSKYYAFYAAMDEKRVPRMFMAESNDGITFEKRRESLLPDSRNGYRMDDTWRDPYVFWDEEEENFKMVFCAKRIPTGPNSFPGVVGLAKSADLKQWELLPPLWLESMTTAPECPDIFKIGNKWAMIYYWHSTYIRTADSLRGPWKRSKDLSPDHFDFMSGKQMFDGKRRLLVGWIPRKECDCGERIWGGNLACIRELTFDDNGNPKSRFFKELDTYYPTEYAVLSADNLKVSCGNWKWNRDGFTAGGLFESAFGTFQNCPTNYRFNFKIKLDGDFTVGMLMIRTQADKGRLSFSEITDEGYMLMLDKPSGMLRLRELYQWDQRPDLAVIPCNFDEETYVDLLLHDDILEVNINESKSLVYRLLKHSDGGLSICVQDGVMHLSKSTIYTPA